MPDATASKKYRLASDLSQTVRIAEIGKKIMSAPVRLSFREVLAVSWAASN